MSVWGMVVVAGVDGQSSVQRTDFIDFHLEGKVKAASSIRDLRVYQEPCEIILSSPTKPSHIRQKHILVLMHFTPVTQTFKTFTEYLLCSKINKAVPKFKCFPVRWGETQEHFRRGCLVSQQRYELESMGGGLRRLP